MKETIIPIACCSFCLYERSLPKNDRTLHAFLATLLLLHNYLLMLISHFVHVPLKHHQQKVKQMIIRSAPFKVMCFPNHPKKVTFFFSNPCVLDAISIFQGLELYAQQIIHKFMWQFGEICGNLVNSLFQKPGFRSKVARKLFDFRKKWVQMRCHVVRLVS